MLSSVCFFLTLCVASTYAGLSLVTITTPGFYPEGLAYSSSLNTFITSSQLGAIYTVSDSGTTTLFGNASSFSFPAGIQVDEGRGYIYVANVNFTAASNGITTGFLGSVVTLSLVDGSVVKQVDISAVGAGPHLPNDVTYDTNGNLYVTDSLGNLIWKVTPAGVASVLVHDNQFAGAGSFPLGLNGIDFHPNGYLLTGKSTGGAVGGLFKVTLAGVVTRVDVSGDLIGLDGLRLDPSDGNQLYVVASDVVYRITSTDNWASARITQEFISAYSGGTSLAFRGSTLFLIHAHLFQVATQFEIEYVDMEDVGPDLVTITQNRTSPEGIDYSPTLGFVCSSIQFATVYTVSDSGVLTNISHYTGLITPLGIQVDEGNNLIYVTNSNFTAALSGQTTGFLAGLVVQTYSGTLVKSIDFSPLGGASDTHLANDIALDPNTGNLYVTDSFGSQIWKVTSGFTPSILVHDTRFTAVGGPVPIGLNGIDYHPDGYLVTCKTFPGALFKVSLTGTVTPTTILPAGLDITGADGLIFRPQRPNNLLVFAGQTVYEFSSSDDWLTANLYRFGNSSLPGGTTITLRLNDVHLIHAHNFDPSSVYEIDKIYFQEYIAPAPTQQPSGPTATGEGSSSESSASFIEASLSFFVTLLFFLTTFNN